MMQTLIYLQLKTRIKDQGFVTIEVIVALLVGLAFFAMAMQSFVYAAAIKVQAQEKQRANQLIQEDMELISQLGSGITNTNLCNPPITSASGVTPVVTDYDSGYAKALWDALQTAAAGTNTTTTVTRTLIKKIEKNSSNEAVVATDGKELGLQRFHISDGNSDHPHRTLKIGYQVWQWDGTNFKNKDGGTITATDKPIAETYVEIIPDVALACP